MLTGHNDRAAALYAAAIAEWQAASEELISAAEASDVPTAADLAHVTKRALSEDLPRYQKRLAKLQAMMPIPPEPTKSKETSASEPAQQSRESTQEPHTSGSYVLEIYTGNLEAHERETLVEEGFRTTNEPNTLETNCGKSRVAVEALQEKLHNSFSGRISTNVRWSVEKRGGARPGAGRKPDSAKAHTREPLYQQGYDAGYQAGRRQMDKGSEEALWLRNTIRLMLAQAKASGYSQTNVKGAQEMFDAICAVVDAIVPPEQITPLP